MSAKRQDAVSIRIDGVELVPGKCFSEAFPSCDTPAHSSSVNSRSPPSVCLTKGILMVKIRYVAAGSLVGGDRLANAN
jgi:hypothetical protein